ncbi:MAG: DNA polymerase III subunit gamma/tau [Candidatus Omnitrophota bacterium]
MTYLPFARKHRPQDFDEVVGQEHITTILKNAISMDRLHHAYLFAGPRGIGKTSTARILSKALNCEKGTSITPCNKCISCKEISEGISMDVIEIDGASNRGIDEIRDLRQTVKFAPSKGKFKIYIIDEVHMLTSEAFNALLKTLEEPPMHVKFIFATTEPHKLPATILSRCQRFDFRRIPLKEITSKLKDVARQENLNVEEDVFLYIAKSSDGSMRDAESILDQMSSFSKGTISLKDVIESLGMIDEEVFFKGTDFIINKDTKNAIYLVTDIFDSGKDPKVFLLGMLEHFRNIMIVKTGLTKEDMICLSKDSIARVEEQSRAFSQGDIFYIMNVLSNSLDMIKRLLPERIVLEMCMIKLTSRDSISSIQEILERLPEAGDVSDSFISNAQAVDPKPQDSSKETLAKKIQHSVKQMMTADNKVIERPHTKDLAFDIDRVKNAWPILVKAMAVKKMSISSYLSEGQPDSIKGDTINIAFPRELNFHREVLEEKQNKDAIESTLSQILDSDVKLSFIATDKKIEPIREEKPPSSITKDELKQKEPIIDSALNIFGGKILRMRNT